MSTLDLDLVIKSKEVLNAKSAPGGKLLGLRGLAFGPDGDLYVAQGKDTGGAGAADDPLGKKGKDASAIFRFSGATAKGPLKYKETFVKPDASQGLAHPCQPLFSSAGDLYVSCQNTNVVVAFYGPKSASAGKPTPRSAVQSRFSSPRTAMAAQASSTSAVPAIRACLSMTSRKVVAVLVLRGLLLSPLSGIDGPVGVDKDSGEFVEFGFVGKEHVRLEVGVVSRRLPRAFAA
jgi:hypothetical protein